MGGFPITGHAIVAWMERLRKAGLGAWWNPVFRKRSMRVIFRVLGANEIYSRGLPGVQPATCQLIPTGV